MTKMGRSETVPAKLAVSRTSVNYYNQKEVPYSSECQVLWLVSVVTATAIFQNLTLNQRFLVVKSAQYF